MVSLFTKDRRCGLCITIVFYLIIIIILIYIKSVIIYYKFVSLKRWPKSSPNLKDVLVFLTGCDVVPPLGFGNVSSSVQFSEAAQLPLVSTCALTLTFPISFPTDPSNFKEKMEFSILGSQGFFGHL